MNVREVVDRIIVACNVPPLEKTCDQLMAGSWDNEVTGIVTTFMATVEVIHNAIAKGANLIITHEPTYYTGADQTDWLLEDEVYLRKQQLLDKHQINIWRYHDRMHLTRPDQIYSGINKELHWEQYMLPDKICYVLPSTTVEVVAVYLKEKLKVNAVQIVGNREAKVERVGILVGGSSLGFNSEQMPMELMRDKNLDVLVCGEILEWTLCAYVRDAAQLGLNKAMIILGHNRTEEVGMKHLTEWLVPLLPGVPVQFSEAGEPFTYV
ncbi:MAG TPA: Nif3-like dinuclear metal center hexameric protein [Aggregatilineaceae bacterium]|nr:Nif3-like dinuclear metal center hexameric protein [Aggregatilineaceae bacterium]